MSPFDGSLLVLGSYRGRMSAKMWAELIDLAESKRTRRILENLRDKKSTKTTRALWAWAEACRTIHAPK